jgi:hypothetical protein
LTTITAATHPGRRHRWKVLAAGGRQCRLLVFSGIPVTSVVLRSDYQLSNGQLGLALGLLSLGVAGELPWGLTDRLGDRKVLLAGLLGTSAALGC